MITGSLFAKSDDIISRNCLCVIMTLSSASEGRADVQHVQQQYNVYNMTNMKKFNRQAQKSMSISIAIAIAISMYICMLECSNGTRTRRMLITGLQASPALAPYPHTHPAAAPHVQRWTARYWTTGMAVRGLPSWRCLRVRTTGESLGGGHLLGVLV
jgi:hypothetical protein